MYNDLSNINFNNLTPEETRMLAINAVDSIPADIQSEVLPVILEALEKNDMSILERFTQSQNIDVT